MRLRVVEAPYVLPLFCHPSQENHTTTKKVLDRLRHSVSSSSKVPVLGLYGSESQGNIVLYGDSHCLDTVRSGKDSCEWLVRLLARYAAKVPRDGLVSYSNAETDMTLQTQLSNTLSPKMIHSYSNNNDAPVRLSHDVYSRLVDVSTVYRWNPNEDESSFWDCSVVGCAGEPRKSEICRKL